MSAPALCDEAIFIINSLLSSNRRLLQAEEHRLRNDISGMVLVLSIIVFIKGWYIIV
jgi:hypothetical protein